VLGHFRREGATVQVSAEVLHSGEEGPRAVAQVEGALADLADLESALLERLSQMLGLGRLSQPPERKANLEAREKFVLGKRAYLRGEYEEASALGRAALQLDPQFSEAIGFVGVCLARLGRYEEAEAQHRQQEGMARQSGDVRREAEALANLGVMHYFRGDYESAESYLVRAAAVAESLDLASESAQIRNNLGFVLFRLGRPAEAEQAFLRAIETHRAYGGLTSLVGPYNGMGNVLGEQRRYAEARTYYRRALALATEIGDRSSVGITLLHLGRCATQEGRFADAKHEFTMALNALEETRFWNGLARAYEYIAEMHVQLGNYDEAARCADKRIELARQHSNVRMESAAWLQKAEALKRAGRTEEAATCIARGQGAEGAAPGGSS
jgi:tetratricopeptide (TPR) repeat protein